MTILLPNGETWVNGGEGNTNDSIAWIRSMFYNAKAPISEIPIEEKICRGYVGSVVNGVTYHKCIKTTNLTTNLIIETPTMYNLTTNYKIKEI